MIVEFLDEAAKDLLEASLWYESKEPGLGVRFRSEAAHVTGRVAEDPLLWRERAGGYRRVNFPVFPFYPAYLVRQERVIVFAVGHERRKPEYWKAAARS